MTLRRFREIFKLEFTALSRSRTLIALVLAACAWVLILPHQLKSDGTADGARELTVSYSLTGVFVLLVVAMVASATASIARERAEKRLQLTLIRPVRYFLVVAGKIAAHAAVAAVVLLAAMAALSPGVDLQRRSWHVSSPVLPSPREEALAMYDAFISDPDTGAEIKRAKKSVILRILEQRAFDHYQTVPTNSTVSWAFPAADSGDGPLAVRLRFTNQFEMRQDVAGIFRLGTAAGVVSNITQAVIDVPLAGADGCRRDGRRQETLTFENLGSSSLMLRPRRDIKLLSQADEFWKNMVRSYLEMLAAITLITSLAMFLSACLGRPVALFTAMVVLVVSEISPSVIQQYPDQLEADVVDRIGLALTRTAAGITRPISALSPVEKLAKDECIETGEVVRATAVNMFALPALLALLAAAVMPHKQED